MRPEESENELMKGFLKYATIAFGLQIVLILFLIATGFISLVTEFFLRIYEPMILLVARFGKFKGESAMIEPVWMGIALGVVCYSLLFGLVASLVKKGPTLLLFGCLISLAAYQTSAQIEKAKPMSAKTVVKVWSAQKVTTADDSFLNDVKTFTTDGGIEGKRAWARLRTLPHGKFIRRLLAMRKALPVDDSMQPRIAFVLCRLDYKYASNARIVASALSEQQKYRNFYADDAAQLVGLLIDRGDKSLLPILLRSADYADGGLAEVLSESLAGYLVTDTDALLEALLVQPRGTRSKIYRLIGVADGFKMDDKQRVRRRLREIKNKAKVYAVAQELLTTILPK